MRALRATPPEVTQTKSKPISFRLPQARPRPPAGARPHVEACAAAVQAGSIMSATRRLHGRLAIGRISAEPRSSSATEKRAMTIHEDVLAAIGNTPLIKLRRASEETGCTILGKAEFMNPGQSVKDRAAREMILGAERRGEVRARGGLLAAAGGEEGGGPRARPP